jgi:hypothetical protein
MSLDTMLVRLVWEALLLAALCIGWAAIWYAVSYRRAGRLGDEEPQATWPVSRGHLRALIWVPAVREMPRRGAPGANARAVRLHPTGHAPGSWR